ncbi:MAG: methionyl-tRNA formyltransferase-like protein [Proteobacteria bacterium]|nr:methionyl-tRNA formyltransferase-like protein [Pseudomonadota bacterium]
MRELSDVLAASTAAIELGYFRLSIHGGDPVYRERVYCYELYHQMRLRWPRGCQFWLNGEVDKIAHPILTELGLAGHKPDLLVHTPGDMRGNHAVMEVKAARGVRDGVCKDLFTLSEFRNRAGYERAIYLVYGEDIDERLMGHIAKAVQIIRLSAPVELWLHHAPGEAAIQADTLRAARP